MDTAYSVPEEGKYSQAHGEPGIIVSQHRPLPHLVKRRQYVSDGSNSPAPVEQGQPSNSPGTGDQKPWASNSPGQTGETKKTGLDLNLVPRISVAASENTVQGIKCTAKAQMTNSVLCPNATTRHYTPDEGNSIYRLFRVTSQCGCILLDGSSFFASSSLPFGAIAQPFADLSEFEAPIPLSTHGGENLVRCKRCGAYINPGFALMGGGVEVRCNICEGISQVNSPLLETDEGRPELTMGAYDFNAPEVLKGKQITGHNVLLVIESTQNAVNFGMVE